MIKIKIEKYIDMKGFRISVLLCSMFIGLTLNAQVSDITIRFANPSFDCDTKVYCVDVEYSTNIAADTLYGTNVRFFFNEAVLTFKQFSDFAQDYDLTNEIEIITGVGSSGASLFNFPDGEAATWVNAGVQLKNQNAGVGMTQGAFTKYFALCFDVDGSPQGIAEFCPELIWDLEEDGTKGGFFSGNDGVVVTLKDGPQSTIADETVGHLNWAYTGSGSAPYGDYSAMNGGCLTDDCVDCVVPNTPPTLKGNE